MRFMVANAADQPDRFRTALLREDDAMDDLLVTAAKKLTKNAEYEPTGRELVYVMTHEMRRAALVDTVDDVAENDYLVVSFDGSEWQPAAPPAEPPAAPPSGAHGGALRGSSGLATIFSRSRTPSPSPPAAGSSGSGGTGSEGGRRGRQESARGGQGPGTRPPQLCISSR